MNGAAAVFYSVCQRIQDGKLAAGEDYRYGNIGQHKGQDRGSISHGVCAMENDNTVIVSVLFIDGFCQGLLVLRLDICAVQLEEFQKIHLIQISNV